MRGLETARFGHGSVVPCICFRRHRIPPVDLSVLNWNESVLSLANGKVPDATDMKQIVRVSTHLYVLLQLNLRRQQKLAVSDSSSRLTGYPGHLGRSRYVSRCPGYRAKGDARHDLYVSLVGRRNGLYNMVN
jgi:hypothetical protein